MWSANLHGAPLCMSGIPLEDCFYALGSPFIQDFLKLKSMRQGPLFLSRKTGLKNERHGVMRMPAKLAAQGALGISGTDSNPIECEHVSEKCAACSLILEVVKFAP
jgi:hypothetical protein